MKVKYILKMDFMTQMDLCGSWIDTFENKTKRRLRPRETKEDRGDDQSPTSTSHVR